MMLESSLMGFGSQSPNQSVNVNFHIENYEVSFLTFYIGPKPGEQTILEHLNLII